MRLLRPFAVLGVGVLLLPLVVSAAQISEIRLDQPSTDNDEYFELFGLPNESLSDFTYLVLGDGTGGSGVIEAVISLAGQSIPASGYFVAAEATFTLGTADLVASLNFENGDNVTHLLVYGFTGANGDDLDLNDDCVLDVTPWTAVVDRVALIEEDNPPTATECHYGPPVVGPDGAYLPAHVYLCPSGWNIGPFDPVGGSATARKSSANNCRPTSTGITAGDCSRYGTRIGLPERSSSSDRPGGHWSGSSIPL